MTEKKEELMRLLDLDVDGMTTPEEGRRLESHGGGPEFILEKNALENVHRVLDSARIQVKSGFKDNVMAALPVASWEAKGRWAWVFPAAVFALFMVATVGLMGQAEAPMGGALGGLLASVGQMIVATAATGAGLLDASWRALGWGVRDLVLSSPAIGVGFGLALLSLAVLLYSLLRQRNRKKLSHVRSRRR